MSNVNSQITDSVTQTNTKILGEMPAFTTGSLMQMATQAAGLSIQNSVTNQQQSNMLHQASTTQGMSILYSVDTAANAQAIGSVNRSNDTSRLTDALAVIKAAKNG
ncbi:RebB family R body protein [Caedibacter taeniospiralis]|uniref:RebB n=1 Tax=Caedibacter taeniospiralis TaxID=28907 RepID=Q46365_CAETA|nr:RebB family R body protein [Caedibacter taeniospiralis]AAA73405.1 RebB [Caedibacter taeniospiralis]AAA73409.1 RebB [Caedibacter taeniospiralis]AAR87076.1 RebB [Caedibacter taeniospiralis]prf//2014290B rebB gene [Caedibacter taeniospiralis]